MKKLFLLFLFLVSLVLAQAAPPGDVTASQLNRTWKLRNNEFKVWALRRQHLQIEFLGFYEHQTANGPTANEGQGSGIALKATPRSSNRTGPKMHARSRSSSRAGNYSLPKPAPADSDSMSPRKAAYKKVSSKKPEFDSE